LSFLCCAVFAASTDDACISFSTTGPDRYADGSVVLDGECYALVWSRDGVFEGFTADGKCIDAEDRTVLVAPVAKGGRCPPVLFQVSEATATALSGGKYSVYLLDTRVTSDGVSKPRGTSDGRPALVNGYGEATASLKVSGFAAKSSAAEKESSTAGQVASVLAAAPADCAQPKIKGMRVDGDNVYLTVENLKGFMRVQGGRDVSASDSTGAATETTGSDEDIVLVTPKTGDSGFFRVICSAP
jgi:hypothetical protein